jgi:hypothetical protein
VVVSDSTGAYATGAKLNNRAEMGESSELRKSVLHAVLYKLMELQKDVDGAEVLRRLMLNVPNYYGDMTQRRPHPLRAVQEPEVGVKCSFQEGEKDPILSC